MTLELSEDYLGCWCALAFDADKSVRAAARPAWDDVLHAPIYRGVPKPPSSAKIVLKDRAYDIIAYLSNVVLSHQSSMASSLANTADTNEDDRSDVARRIVGAADALIWLMRELRKAIPLICWA